MAEHSNGNDMSAGKQLIEFLVMILLVIGCFFGLRTFVVGTYEIPSGSMEDTIAIGDRVFSEKISYYSRTPEVGEIITFNDPLKEEQTLIKRRGCWRRCG